ncbi:MAG TPA: hypothetical protein VH062_04475 [Polyangiaceae bacterium]|jgi:hypothetical protein|nr:hypothetical protein [Polyangiaceae bacterium]
MKRLLFAGCITLAMVGCKKKDDVPNAAPTVTAPPPAVSIAPIKDPEPEATASAVAAGGAPAEPAPPTTPDAVPKKPVSSGSVQSCCTALEKAADKAGKTGKTAQRYAAASSVCAGLEKSLKAGKANLAATKVTLRAQLGGVPVPSGC